LRKYIAEIAQAAVTQEEQAANIRDSSKASSDAMAAQIKTMSDQIAQLAKTIANKKKTHQKGAAVAAAVADYVTENKDESRSNTKSHEAWAATVSRMVSIQLARTTQAPTASGNSQTTTSHQRGTTGKAAAWTGHHPFASASGNRTTRPTQASQHQQTDRDQGRTVQNKRGK